MQTLPPVLASQQAGPAGPKRPNQPAPVAGAANGIKLIGGPEAAPTYVQLYSLSLLAGHPLPSQQSRGRWSNSDTNRALQLRAVKRRPDYRRHL